MESKELQLALAAIGHSFYSRNWVLGTSGNLSAVVGRDPLRVAITPSGAHKGRLKASDLLLVDGQGRAKSRGGKPSAEALLHLEIVRARGAGAVLHTHSVWSTILSDLHANAGGLEVEGFEMLKGLDGITTHAHREWVPIVENSQDMEQLAGDIRDRLTAHGAAHAVLIRRHGCYTWGRTLADAERHVEILEFLFEAIGRGEADHGSR